MRQSEVFSVIADETKDLDKKEQLSLVLRYYYNGVVHESFLDFQQATRLDAEGLKDKIVYCLERYGLDYRSNFIGQGYDGASVMSGKHSGGAARLKTDAKHACHVHCNAHCLNLVLVDAVKAVPEADCFFSFLQKLYMYMSGSYVHQKWLDVQKEMYGGQPSLLATFRRVLGDAKLLSDTLQSASVDLSMAVDLVNALKDSFQDYRRESFVDNLWNVIVDTATNCSIATENVKKRSQKVSARLGTSLITSTIGQRKCTDGEKDNFKRTVFYPIVDIIVGELDRCFSKDNCDLMKGIHALNPKNSGFLQEEAVFCFGEIYESDSEDLRHELHQARRLLQRKQQSGMQKLSSIVELAVFLEPYKDVFHELFRLCKIGLALPVSSAASERSFSALKLIKTHLRITMTDDRLSATLVSSALRLEKLSHLTWRSFCKPSPKQENQSDLNLTLRLLWFLVKHLQ